MSIWRCGRDTLKWAIQDQFNSPKKITSSPPLPHFSTGGLYWCICILPNFWTKHRFSIMHCQLIAWTLFTTASLERPSNLLSLWRSGWDSLTPIPSAHWEGRNNNIGISSTAWYESHNESLEESKDSWFGQNWRKSKVLDMKGVIVCLWTIESETNLLP